MYLTLMAKLLSPPDITANRTSIKCSSWWFPIALIQRSKFHQTTLLTINPHSQSPPSSHTSAVLFSLYSKAFLISKTFQFCSSVGKFSSQFFARLAYPHPSSLSSSLLAFPGHLVRKLLQSLFPLHYLLSIPSTWLCSLQKHLQSVIIRFNHFLVYSSFSHYNVSAMLPVPCSIPSAWHPEASVSE